MAGALAGDPSWAGGDPVAEEAASGFDAFVRRYERLVRSLIGRTAPNEDAVDDLSQDVFLDAFTKLDTLRDPSRLRGWLAALALNRARSWGRRRKVEVAALPRLAREDLSAANAPVAAEQSERRAAIALALSTLPDATRRVVEMRYLEGRSAPEIGEALGLSPEAVRMRLSRALRSLRAELAIHDVGGEETRAPRGAGLDDTLEEGLP